MAITHKYTLLCDDIRQENNGKFILVGLYTPDIVVPAVPFALPGLSFFSVLESDAPSILNFSFRLLAGDTLMSGGSGQMNISKAGTTALPLRLGGLLLPSAGPYRFVMDVEGNEQITHEFSVILQMQNVQPVGPQAGGVH